MTDNNHQTIRGYELRQKLGQGGFGAVYLAYQPLVKREVAIKVVLPELANDPDFIRRFETEAELIARLEHPFIVPLFDYWREPDGAYLVMRMLRGGNLREYIEREEVVSPERCADIFDQIAAALTVAHREGVIHRDIKPDNILLDEDGNAYLSDFGIAKRLDAIEDDDDVDEGLTGSIHYIPPEQIKGIGVSPQTDVYALGMMLFEMLAGEHPYEGEAITQIVMKHLHDSLPPLEDFDPELYYLEDLIQRATAKEPEDRYDSVLDMAKELRALVTPDTTVSEQTTEFYTPLDVDLPNPYRGLQAFQEADSDKFFGRTELVETLLNRLSDRDEVHHRFLAVIGASGSGKSSVVKAGLIPRLRQGGLPGSENWFIAEMFPGEKPFEQLADALLRVGVNTVPDLETALQQPGGVHDSLGKILTTPMDQMVLIIDQFEELFTGVEDEDTRARFLAGIQEAFEHPQSQLRVIVTLRADYYDRPLQYREFGQILRQRIETVLPLSPEEIAQVIQYPAENVGAMFEPGLVEAIVADVSEQTGMLPLLQYALTQLFEERVGYLLTLEKYLNIGGVTGALAQRADELYQSFDTNAQEAIRQLFLRLVTVSEGSQDTRRRIRRSELPENPAIEQVVDAFGKSRLLTFDRDSQTREGTIEVAHEAIIRTWQRLRGWIDDSREQLLQQRRLTTAAREWQEASQDPGYLASGARLIQFETLLDSDIVLNRLEEHFLRESIDHREELKRLEEARKEQELLLERRAANRLRYLVGVMVLFLVVAVGLSVLALNGEAQARNNAATAVAAESTAVRREILSSSRALAQRLDSIAENDPFIAYSLARDLLTNVTAPPESARSAALSTLIDTRVLQQMELPGSSMREVDFTPDSTGVVTGTTDGRLILWDINTGDMMREFAHDGGEILEIVFIPQSNRFVTVNMERQLAVWSLESEEPEGRIFESVDQIRSLTFTPDGSTALLGNGGGFLILYDMESGDSRAMLPTNEGTILEVAVSDDGTYAATGGSDRRLSIVNIETGEILHTINNAHNDLIFDVEINDGRVVSTSTDGTAKVWDIETGESLQVLENHDAAVFNSVLTDDGRFVLTVSQDEQLVIQRYMPIAPVRLSGHTNAIFGVDISSDQTMAVTASSDGTVVIWDLTTAQRYDNFPVPATNSRGVSFHPDGETAFINLDDSYIVRWNWQTNEILQQYAADDDTAIVSVEVVPGGETILSGTEDGRVLRFDVNSGEILQVYDGHDARVWGAQPLSDGERATTGSLDTRALLWDLDSGEILQEYSGIHTDEVVTAMPSPDDRLLATASSDTTIGIWNLESGELIRQLDEHTRQVIGVTFSPDSSLMVSYSLDGSILVWDTTTWETIRSLGGHQRAVLRVRFIPDNPHYAVSVSWDETLILWDVQTGAIVQRFEGGGSPMRNMDISPDGEYALTTGWEGNVFLWWVNPDQDTVLSWAADHLPMPDLTCEDRLVYQTPLICDGTGNITPVETPPSSASNN